MTAFVVPAALVVALIVSHISTVNSVTMAVDSFSIGDCVVARFTAPSVQTKINLRQDDSSVLLYVQYRVDNCGLKSTILLNFKLGNWTTLTKKTVTVKQSTPGTVIEFIICAVDDKTFSVTFNSNFLTNYSNDKINISNLSAVQFVNYEGNARLVDMYVKYAATATDK